MMGFNFIGKSIQAGLNFIVNINSTAINLVGVGEEVSKSEKVISRFVGVTTGGAGLGRGVYDTASALAC